LVDLGDLEDLINLMRFSTHYFTKHWNMGYTYAFEKLEVWLLSKHLICEAYKLSKRLPEDERFGIRSQFNRAIVSVGCNIAEGSSRSTAREKARYITISYGSLVEVVALLIIIKELEFITETEHSKFRVSCEELSNKLNAYRNFLQKGKL
jgi:four helix bundle protein